MAKAKEEESIRLSALEGQVVGNIEIAPLEAKPQMPLHFMAGVQEHSFGEVAALNY
jgi:hypothetical protein